MQITQRLILSLALMLFTVVPHYAQSAAPPAPINSAAGQANNNELELKRMALLADLQALAADASNLDTPLALALAKAEIADAAWTLDSSWSKQLLREAYELTLPTEEELSKRRDEPSGTSTLAGSTDRARDTVRARVLQVAARDSVLAKELTDSGARKLEQRQAQGSYAALASQALQKGDTVAAGKYIEQSIKVDPTQMDPGFSIMQLAAKDREAADKLIIEYMNSLRAVPPTTQSAARTYVMLQHLVFPASAPPIAGVPQRVPPPGPAVMKAYVSFMIENLARLEQNEPGSLQRFRPMLINVWPVLKQYAPELTGAFYQVEAMSRRQGEDASLPQGNMESLSKERYEKRVKDALDSDKPDPLTIHAVISKGDFAQARRMIDKLDDGAQKTQLIEAVNTQEAISLASKGDLAKARQLAQQLKEAVSVMRVYPVILNKCVADKDRICAADTVAQAVKQLKNSNNTPPSLPPGVPASLASTEREFDPVTLSLCQLAKAVAPLDGTLALEVLDETVQAANRSNIDTAQGRTGLETDVFKRLAAVDETRVYQATSNLKQRLPKIAALAALYQWKAQKLANAMKAANAGKAMSGK